LLPTMPRGRTISEDLRRCIVEMAKDMPYEEIYHYTDVSIRSIQRFVLASKEGSTLAPKERDPAPTRVLHDNAIRVSIFTS
jgi:hypothetical protein